MAKNYPIPNLDNITPAGCVDMIAGYREQQASGKFYEGIYKQKLQTLIPEGQKAVEGERYCGEYTEVSQERIDTDAVKAAFSREQLLEKGFLKVTSFKTFRTVAREEKK